MSGSNVLIAPSTPMSLDDLIEIASYIQSGDIIELGRLVTNRKLDLSSVSTELMRALIPINGNTNKRYLSLIEYALEESSKPLVIQKLIELGAQATQENLSRALVRNLDIIIINAFLVSLSLQRTLVLQQDIEKLKKNPNKKIQGYNKEYLPTLIKILENYNLNLTNPEIAKELESKDTRLLSMLAEEALNVKEIEERAPGLLFLADQISTHSSIPYDLKPGIKISVRFQDDDTKEYIFYEGEVLKIQSRGKNPYVYVNYKDAESETTWKHIISSDFVYRITPQQQLQDNDSPKTTRSRLNDSESSYSKKTKLHSS